MSKTEPARALEGADTAGAPGDGTGRCGAWPGRLTGDRPHPVVVADVDRDGRCDAVTADCVAGVVGLLPHATAQRIHACRRRGRGVGTSLRVGDRVSVRRAG